VQCSQLTVCRCCLRPLQVQKLSPQAQAIIHSYTDELTAAQSTAGAGAAFSSSTGTHTTAVGSTSSGALNAWTAAVTHTLPWRTPTREDYLALLDETEYGAW
jgi:hypothetical protein